MNELKVKIESVERKGTKKSKTEEVVTYKVTMKGENGTKVVVTTKEQPFIEASEIGKEIIL